MTDGRDLGKRLWARGPGPEDWIQGAGSREEQGQEQEQMTGARGPGPQGKGQRVWAKRTDGRTDG